MSRGAEGLARVTRIANNGRVQIVPVTGDDARAWLTDEAGYPELADDVQD